MAASCKKVVVKVLKEISSLTQHPEDFLATQKTTAKKFTNTLKSIYDTAKCTELSADTTTLPELIVKDFDEEQIWQQLELQNDYTFSNLVTDVAKLLTQKKKCSFHSDVHRDKDGGRRQKVADKKTKAKKVKEKSVLNDLNETSDVESDENEQNEEKEASEASDEEISKIKSRLGNEEDDKFFDFTGDSDEDLNFDFGPLGQGGIGDDDYEEDGGDDDDDDKYDGDDGGGGSNDHRGSNDMGDIKVKPKGRNKSVRFKDDLERTKDTKGKQKDANKKGSIVDDAFFKLADLEVFLEQEDKKEEKRQKREKTGIEDESDSDDDASDEDIDMFAELDSGDEDLHYEDFFDPPDLQITKPNKDGKAQRVVEREQGNLEDGESSDDEEVSDDDDEEGNFKDDEDDDDDDEEKEDSVSDKKTRKALDLLADSDSEGEDVNEILGRKNTQQKSTYEQRQEKLKKKISELESGAIAEKPWQLSGEITAANRPENSLLQENVEFEHTTRLPPEITEETTKTLEELILQRIKDKAFDDVERKVKPKENPFEYKKRITLDQEKSKMSLGEIYEQEYLKQQKNEEEEDKVDPDHDAIKKMMQSLFIKLDALSNFHYTPKQAAPEVKIVSNQPSISMEEVAPVSVSDSKLLAPQEVQEKQKGELKGSTEKTKTDKLRERKQKKAVKRERQKDREKRQKLIEKLNPGLGNKYSKEKAMRKLEKESKKGHGVTLIKDDKKQKTGLTSSKAFFTQLQDEVTTHINSKKAEKRKKDGKIQSSSKKFKL